MPDPKTFIHDEPCALSDGRRGSAEPPPSHAAPWFRSAKMRLLAAPLIATAIWVPGQALAQTASSEGPADPQALPAEGSTGDWSLSLGAGLGIVPRYEGSDDHKLAPVPLISVSWRDLLFLETRRLGVNAIQQGKFTLGAALGYSRGREEDDADRLSGMGDIDATAHAQIFAKYSIDRVTFNAAVSRDMAGSESTLAEFGVQAVHPIAEKIAITTGANLVWADNKHMDAFFGVTQDQSAASGLPAYEADAGFKRINFTTGAIFRLREKWMLRGNATLGYLTGGAADSPLVEKRFQPGFVLGIAHAI